MEAGKDRHFHFGSAEYIPIKIQINIRIIP